MNRGIQQATGRKNCIGKEYGGVNNGKGIAYGKFNKRKLVLNYSDDAGCSRILHNSSFTIEELYQHIYYSKPSNYERNAGYDEFEPKKYELNRKQESGTLEERYNLKSKNNHPTLKSLKLLFSILTLFKTVDIEKQKILIPFSGVFSEKIAMLAHGFKDENITTIEINPDYVEIGMAREKFWIDNNFFFTDKKEKQEKIKTEVKNKENKKSFF
jgi:hypothetical protein